ncbi:MAG: class I SAM-dependent methyltransferase [Sphingobacteriales bacterium]|jgi:ubiquinone/menaquinone biosynthesis C-methylase UbiE|nr:class I SAM-dependent methyltransferase [Sphingobacteriales bacterium]MBK6890963.1 class I SAM-dependent methyltransferase [Sphingobacteriales bacterium]MBK8677698.1 class I SAM-dependent methyltransferase [Sphingobacteriales bacterium]MDA0199581.1 class I SAM-dependent methyltransferase [Bacteroidota bacterium]
MEQKKYIPALGYDFLTAYYDMAIKITMPEKKFRRLLVEEINPQENEHILEFGFGTGQNLLLVHKTNPKTKLEGLDIDPKVKAIAEHKLAKNNIEIPLHLYNGSVLPFADNSFNKVYSCLVFHQLDAETKLNCLKELHRVMKPNGKLIIADWGKAQNKLMRLTFGLVQLLDGFKTTNDNVKGLMPDFISKADFENVVISKSINTAIGTFSYFKAIKNEIS